MDDRLLIQLPQKTISYDIVIQEELLKSEMLLDYCQKLGSQIAIITDLHVEKLYGNQLLYDLKNHHLNARLISFPAGEKYKTRQTKEYLENRLFEHKIGRDGCLLALGGGVVTDLAGFVASTYCRGIPFMMLPTSLLAMVDASIGGKTGLDVPFGKNMLGTIYQPSVILMDINTLKTLPDKEWKNGLVEMIKHGLIVDESYFHLLEKEAMPALQFNTSLLKKLIYQSCLIKKQIIEEDEHEKGKRCILNFGHTVGHAIETITHHEVAHGQAVAIGILAESYLSMLLGYLPATSFERIVNIFTCYGIEMKLKQPIASKEIIETMKMDKKAVRNQTRFVILQQIGHCLDCDSQFCATVDEQVLQQALQWTCHVMSSN